MTRKELYQEINKHNLKDAIRAKFNDNYTHVKTSDLEEYVNAYLDSFYKEEPKTQPIRFNTEGNLEEAFVVLVSTLVATGTIGHADAEHILSKLS